MSFSSFFYDRIPPLSRNRDELYECLGHQDSKVLSRNNSECNKIIYSYSASNSDNKTIFRAELSAIKERAFESYFNFLIIGQ